MTESKLLALFDQYHNMVYRLALTATRSPQDAEDIVQTVFLKLLDGKSVPMPGKERAWLAQVTVNACRDLLRSFWRRKIHPLDESIPFSTPEEGTLFDAVLELPAKYRLVVHLHYYEGYTVCEIAAMTGMSESNVKARLKRGRDKLREFLTDKD